MLMELAGEFVKQLNSAVEQFDTTNESHVRLVSQLAGKMCEIMKACETSEEFINASVSKMEYSLKECRDVVYVRRDENIRAIVSRDVIKPSVNAASKICIKCNCPSAPLARFDESKGCTIVDSEEELRRLDKALESVVLGVFDHDYRSFEGFACFIGLYAQNGWTYIIDAVRFRDIIPQLRLLTCGVKKIICSQRGVERLVKDFGSIGCYQNFNVPDSNVFIDWRIRPLNEILCRIICNELVDAVEKHNLGLAVERHRIQPADEVSDFMDFFAVHESHKALVEDLVKLRMYLAKKNDESPQYVMTDTQLYQLVLNMPGDVDELELLLNRMSPILRLHASDFLLILNQKSKVFSLESLKAKKVESGEVPEAPGDALLEGRYRSFSGIHEETCADESGSSLEVSD